MGNPGCKTNAVYEIKKKGTGEKDKRVRFGNEEKRVGRKVSEGRGKGEKRGGLRTVRQEDKAQKYKMQKNIVQKKCGPRERQREKYRMEEYREEEKPLSG